MPQPLCACAPPTIPRDKWILSSVFTLTSCDRKFTDADRHKGPRLQVVDLSIIYIYIYFFFTTGSLPESYRL